jgi:alkaline phosphatase
MKKVRNEKVTTVACKSVKEAIKNRTLAYYFCNRNKIHDMKNLTILLLNLVVIGGCSSQPQSMQGPKPPVKNVILMIGDGMGVAQIYAGYTANKSHLNLFKAQYVGFSLTCSADQYITDSGAGATAISTGEKTNNSAIGVDMHGTAQKTILESAEDKGLSTGLVVTCPITHATPAAFVAHQINRNENTDIAGDFVGSGIDIFIGGGRLYFEDANGTFNFSDSLRKLGYSIVNNLNAVHPADSSKIGCFVADMDLPMMTEGRGDFLSKATRLALSKLAKNDKGFFIMIEGSQIDWGGHSNDIQYIVSEVIDFDKAVGEAFQFADQQPGTLVIVTADHETGGLSITGGDLTTGELEANFGTINHSAVMVPVFAYGQGAEKFAGVYENTEIHYKIMQALGLD